MKYARKEVKGRSDGGMEGGNFWREDGTDGKKRKEKKFKRKWDF